MTEPGTRPPVQRGLHCFQGQPAPPEVEHGWRRFESLPQQAAEQFWEVLTPAFTEVEPDHGQARIETYCAKHDLEQEDVVAAVRACHFLFVRASALDLGPEPFQQDLLTLSRGASQRVDALMSRYEAAKKDLRKAITHASLSDHGKVLVGLDWRLDTMTASDRGVQLSTPIVLLTLRYQEGERAERITLQLTPAALRELQSFCQRFAGEPPV